MRGGTSARPCHCFHRPGGEHVGGSFRDVVILASAPGPGPATPRGPAPAPASAPGPATPRGPAPASTPDPGTDPDPGTAPATTARVNFPCKGPVPPAPPEAPGYPRPRLFPELASCAFRWRAVLGAASTGQRLSRAQQNPVHHAPHDRLTILSDGQPPQSRGLHSSAFRLNKSAFGGIGGAFRGHLGGVQEVSGAIRECVGGVFVSEMAHVELKNGRV